MYLSHAIFWYCMPWNIWSSLGNSSKNFFKFGKPCLRFILAIIIPVFSGLPCWYSHPWSFLILMLQKLCHCVVMMNYETKGFNCRNRRCKWKNICWFSLHQKLMFSFKKINNTVQLLLHIVHIYIGFADYPSLIAFLACAKAQAN